MKLLTIVFCALVINVSAQSDTQTVINIPVLVHVVYDNKKSKCDEPGANKEQNISTQLIRSELQNLNEDFMLLNHDTSEVIDIFKSRISNPRINFYLDTTYVTGGEPGIIRVFNKDDLDWTTASPIIDHTRYLNVYIVNYTHSYTANDHVWDTPKQDAIFLYFCWVGRKYRLLTHEVGHWLGLRHLWGTGTGKGDKNSCPVGDDINDTPPQKEATNTACDYCPSSVTDPLNKKCGTSEYLTNYNNFMDYSGCRRMFTIDQVTRMRSNLFLHRATMTSNSKR